MNWKLALVFLVVLAVSLKSSQGKSLNDIKDDLEDVKKPVVAFKTGIAKSVAAKIKLAAFKKWLAIKAIARAPFVLGKKAVSLKIKAIKSLAALKAAKAKKILKFAGEKIAPAAAAVVGIPAVVAGVSAALKPKPASLSQVTHQTEVIDSIYTYPGGHGHQQHYQQPQQYQIPANGYYYKSELNVPRTYSNDYSLVPENSGSQYYPVSDIIQPHEIYGVPAN